MNLIFDPWFRLSIGRRADLSGLPIGVLFIWKPRDNPGKYSPSVNRIVGFHFPQWLHLWRRKNLIFGELPQLTEIRPPHSHWSKWSDCHRQACEAAVKLYVAEIGPTAKIVGDFSYCHRRIDLSGMPWQLYRGVLVAK